MNKSLLLFAKKRWIDGWIDRHGQTDDRQTDRQRDGRTDGRTDRRGKDCRTSRHVFLWTNVCIRQIVGG